MQHIDRASRDTLEVLLKTYSVVTIIGPRQTGKTTIARRIRPEQPYVNLEDLRAREFAQNDPIAFLEQFPDGAIIDEIQRVPQLTSQIQVIVDEHKKKGMFLLTGSYQFEIIEGVSQSLSGRSAVFRLLPLTVGEVLSSGASYDSSTLLYQGGYPQIHSEDMNPTFFYQDYISTYLERDLRQLREIRNLEHFRRFLKLAAGRIGQILDLQDLGDSTGVSQTTAKDWIEILQASMIVFLLQPYHANISKRIVKRPKLYFYDTGLALYLLDATRREHIDTHPLRGQLFENMVIMEFLKERFNSHLPINCYFYRDKEKTEVDLLCVSGAEIDAYEIKSGKTVTSDYFKSLKLIMKTSLPIREPTYVIYDGDEAQQRSHASVLPFKDFALQ